MRRRRRYSLVLVLVLAVMVAVWLRETARPEVVGLLPEPDAIVCANRTPSFVGLSGQSS